MRNTVATYGNHASVGYTYGDLCLMVEVCGVGRRVKAKEIRKGDDRSASLTLSIILCVTDLTH